MIKHHISLNVSEIKSPIKIFKKETLTTWSIEEIHLKHIKSKDNRMGRDITSNGD